MVTETFVRRVELPVSAEEAFAWYERPGAFERLAPPWEDIRVIDRSGTIHDGDRLTFSIGVGPARMIWTAEHRDYQAGRQFRDVQTRGPFAACNHLHLFEPAGPDRSVIEDRIEYVLPYGRLGALVGKSTVRDRFERMFRYRHATLAADLVDHHRYRDRPRVTVAISGASGLIGSALSALLTTGGHEVRRLARRAATESAEEIAWNPATGELETAKLAGVGAVVHLAGASIAQRWTPEVKERIRDSRVLATRRLAVTLAGMAQPPQTLVCASAIGFYGSRGGAMLDENSLRGEGFLASVCSDWEEAARPAVEAGIRVVHARIGIVLSPRGGALAKLLAPFRFGLGGRLGDGRQYWSWVSVDDVLGAIHLALMEPTLCGPVNVTAPEPVTNAEFTATLARVLGRPAMLPVPAGPARQLLGEMAEEMLFASARVMPRRLEAAGYTFRHPTLEAALRHLLGK
jgi:uncharacterized protein (TIGR01777 family)